MDKEYIMYNILTVSVLVISILLLILLTYTGNYCDCHNNTLNKVNHTIIYSLLIILVISICVSPFNNDIYIPIFVLIPILLFFSSYIWDLNSNKCKCLEDKPLLNTLLLFTTNTIILAFFLVLLIIIVAIFDHNNNNNIFSEKTYNKVTKALMHPLQFREKPNIAKSAKSALKGVKNFLNDFFD